MLLIEKLTPEQESFDSSLSRKVESDRAFN